MKKLIGIILALCMLCTIASASAAVSPITGTADDVYKTEETGFKIIVNYASEQTIAQATMLAYDVTNAITEEDPMPDYKNQTDTPIVGIDQTPFGNRFEIALADTFMDEIAAGNDRVIMVKVGGTDVATPMSWLVTFTKPAEGGGEGGEDPDQPGTGGGEGGEDPDQPGTGGGEGGEDPENPGEGGGTTPEGIKITIKYGDVNGDNSVDGADASLILQVSVGKRDGFKDQEEREIPNTVGDVNGDGSVDGADASLILQVSVGKRDGFKDQNENPLTTYTYTYVAPEV